MSSAPVKATTKLETPPQKKISKNILEVVQVRQIAPPPKPAVCIRTM